MLSFVFQIRLKKLTNGGYMRGELLKSKYSRPASSKAFHALASGDPHELSITSPTIFESVVD
jgi:hypothetical protein